MKYISVFFLLLCLAFAVPQTSVAAHKTKQNTIERAQKRSHSAHSRTSASRQKHHKKSSTKQSKDSKNRSSNWVEEAHHGQFSGKASWYGTDFHGGPTASGLSYDMYTFTAAHRTLPIGTVVKVTTKDSGKSVMVCVTDRGPFVRGRIIDLSYAAADQLGIRKKGVGSVNLEVVCDASGTPLKEEQAFYVQYTAAKKTTKAGPFKQFADACAMQEALRQAHPEATVILGKDR